MRRRAGNGGWRCGGRRLFSVVVLAIYDDRTSKAEAKDIHRSVLNL
jgi:hypothetical protein